ncbi:MAG: hypothetical protein HKN72_08605, partial [Gemmatimonadetes bacterium]|nr:hypothetical protein [Gemmatimonadota bacterium]
MRPLHRALAFIGVLLLPTPVSAQLNEVFEDLFNRLLTEDLSFSPNGRHGRHFFDAAAQANDRLTPALNSLIANAVTSFPLSSTVAGITFDFPAGQPVSIRESLGPIFGETGETLGEGKLNVGFNYTRMNPSAFRGLATKDIRLAFAHQDVGGSGVLGDRLDESDVIDLVLDLGIDVHTFVMFATMGVTDALDIGVAVPVHHVRLSGNAVASIDSHTEEQTGNPDHAFPPDSGLEQTIPYDESALGVGDLAVRFKYNFYQGPVYLATLLDFRIVPGDQDDFMSSGRPSFKLSAIGSKQFGGFTSHVNVGYDRRPGLLDSDEFEFVVGFDQKVATGLTFAAELLGELDLDENEAVNLDGTIEITDFDANDQPLGTRVL